MYIRHTDSKVHMEVKDLEEPMWYWRKEQNWKDDSTWFQDLLHI